MSKAVTEVAIGAAAVGAAFALPGLGIALSGTLVTALVSTGASFVMQGIGDALRNNQGGLSVAVTSPVGPWGYVYGTQKVGGVKIFSQSNNNTGGSTTSNNKQLHTVYALACHPCIVDTGGTTNWQLRVGGKQVLVEANGPGWSSYSPTQTESFITSVSRSNGIVTIVVSSGIANQDGLFMQVTDVDDNTFNGNWIMTQPNPADDTTFTYVCGGPDTTSSGGHLWTLYADFQDKIYVEFLNGTQTATFPTLLEAGTSWRASDLCLGRTLVYVQLGWAANVFPSGIPDISFVIQGKNNIYDPRTNSYGYTNNAALCIADFLSIPATQGGFGLTIGTDIPTAALTAAANICDEAVDLAGGGTESRYTCNTFFMLNQTRGSILQSMLTSCAGRISYQGGQYSIFPGAWVAPTLSLTDADLVGGIEWHPRFSIRDTCNAVKGVYVSPENNYEQGDIPAYMQDADHGYVSDQWLAEDNNERIFKEATFLCTDSSAMAQRLAKIALLRTRFQGRGTIRCSLKAYQAVALDVIQLTHPRYTWVNKQFEVLSSRFVPDKSGTLTVELDIAETDPSIYDWSITEQLTPTGWQQPQNIGTQVCDPPNNVSAYSGPGETVNGVVYPSTINTTASGIATNSIYVRWDEIYDTNIIEGGHVEVQWQPNGASYWSALTNIAPTATSIFVPGVTDGAEYNVQMRCVNFANVPSTWVVAGPVTVSSAISSPVMGVTSAAIVGTNSSGLIVVATSSDIATVIGSGIYDAYGAAATAQSNAETYAANASNLSSGTVAVACLPVATSSTLGAVKVPTSATVLGSDSSSQLIAASTTGSGDVVLATGPTLTALVIPPVLYADLPSSPASGTLAVISDASGTPTFHSSASGTGTASNSETYLVIYDGSAWVYA